MSNLQNELIGHNHDGYTPIANSIWSRKNIFSDGVQETYNGLREMVAQKKLDGFVFTNKITAVAWDGSNETGFGSVIYTVKGRTYWSADLPQLTADNNQSLVTRIWEYVKNWFQRH